MKSTIFLKLFLALLSSLLIVVGAMMASTQWSFRKGLSDYIHQVELQRVETLLPVLAQAYQAHGNWEFLRGERHVWIHLLGQGLGKTPLLTESASAMPPPDFFPEPGEPLRPPPHSLPGNGLDTLSQEIAEIPPHERYERLPPGDPLFFIGRLRLLDAEHKPVVGPPFNNSQESIRPITLDNTIVGWLLIRPSTIINDSLALAFAQQQKQANYGIAALALGLSMLASLVLARVFLAPIRRIAAGAQALAAGHYETQIAPSSQDE